MITYKYKKNIYKYKKEHRYIYNKFKYLYKIANEKPIYKLNFIYRFFKMLRSIMVSYIKYIIKYYYSNINLRKKRKLNHYMHLKLLFFFKLIYYNTNRSLFKYILAYKKIYDYYNNCRNNYMDSFRNLRYKKLYIRKIFINYYLLKSRYSECSFILKLKKRFDNPLVIKGYKLKENKIHNYNKFDHYNYVFYFLYYIYIFFLSLFLYWFSNLYKNNDKKNIYITNINNWFSINRKFKFNKKKLLYKYNYIYTHLFNNILLK